ncbi:hypothetical protein EFD32_1184 [Enterococcus faecalis D32]|nr:hypothetical protein EFD32_1184 [Enterococcus faecalis D32]
MLIFLASKETDEKNHESFSSVSFYLFGCFPKT